MRTFQKQLPAIIDLQPLPADASVILPKWILYLFVCAYLCTFAGLFMLLKESYSVVRLYQETVQARRVTEDTVHHITDLQTKLSDAKSIQRDYESFKLRQTYNARPGPIMDWIPSLIPKTQRATALTISKAGDTTTVRLTIEKPIADQVTKISVGPDGYIVKAVDNDNPRFSEIPTGKSDPNNEFITQVITLTQSAAK